MFILILILIFLWFSLVRKQKIPELQIFDYEVTIVNANVSVPKHLMDRYIKFAGNAIVQLNFGPNGDWGFVAFRLIPIEQEPNHKSENDHYRTILFYTYPTKLDDQIKIDDNDTASVIEHVKQMIRKLRPECEMTDVLLELWDLAPKTIPNDPENFPFKNYYPTKRRKLQDIDPSSVDPWTSSRVTLLGDAAHAVNPINGSGTNVAIEDADSLSQALINHSSENLISCIQEYEKEMLKRTSKEVSSSRSFALYLSSPVGYFGMITRQSTFKVVQFFYQLSALNHGLRSKFYSLIH